MKDSFRANLLEQILYYPPKGDDEGSEYSDLFKQFVSDNWNRKELENPLIGKP